MQKYITKGTSILPLLISIVLILIQKDELGQPLMEGFYGLRLALFLLVGALFHQLIFKD